MSASAKAEHLVVEHFEKNVQLSLGPALMLSNFD